MEQRRRRRQFFGAGNMKPVLNVPLMNCGWSSRLASKR
jgi:hypothetical protein